MNKILEGRALSLFRFSGVVGRLQWWITVVLSWVLGQVAFVLLPHHFQNQNGALVESLVVGLGILIFLFLAAVTVKRLRDCGYSPWFILSICVPLAGLLFILIVCGFCPANFMLKDKVDGV